MSTKVSLSGENFRGSDPHACAEGANAKFRRTFAVFGFSFGVSFVAVGLGLAPHNDCGSDCEPRVESHWVLVARSSSALTVSLTTSHWLPRSPSLELVFSRSAPVLDSFAYSLRLAARRAVSARSSAEEDARCSEMRDAAARGERRHGTARD